MTPFADAAQHLAVDLGWRVLPVREHGKEPLTRNGVKDASADERTVLHYWERWPEANVGVATGSPGPDVLDIDDPQAAAFWLAALENAGTPESATARGRHLFYAGTATGTISLGYGELRCQGSYVVVPPSIHPSGKEYVWLNEPRSRVLPPVPESLVADKQSAGVGELPVRAEKVGHGERHDHLKDVAVHLLRAGITDVPTLARMLRAEYEQNCDPHPPARADEFQKLAEWAASTKLAGRENRRRAEREVEVEAPAIVFPSAGASHAEHLAFIAKSAGLPEGLEIAEVRRWGLNPLDALEIHLTDGGLIRFGKQEDAAKRLTWQRAVVLATSGAAQPPMLKDPHLVALLGSLCRVAHAPRAYREAEDHDEQLRELLTLAEPVLGHTLATPASRYELIAALGAREKWDPFDRNTLGSPALIHDEQDERGPQRYLRAGELMDWFRYKGARIASEAFRGRMAVIGLERVSHGSREPMGLHTDPGRRREPRVVLYRFLAGAE